MDTKILTNPPTNLSVKLDFWSKIGKILNKDLPALALFLSLIYKKTLILHISLVESGNGSGI